MSFSGGGRSNGGGMQHVDAQREAGRRKSYLLDSLKVYLNNGSRLQPIIGLGSIVECGTANVDWEALYLCEVCELRLSKGDMRNHILGSLHRYNYIRTRYPHLASEWKDDGDLCKLAWPLMEKAKELESEEGPGDIQVFQVDQALYQTMLASSVHHAMALVNIIRDYDKSQSGTAGAQPESPPSQWGDAALLRDDQQMAYDGHVSAPAQEDDFTLLQLQSPVASPSRDDKSVLSESSCSVLDGYSHLFGLCRVLECKNEEGQTRCFLCHCCGQRTNEGGVVYHLSSSSHLINYLMETRPEQTQALMPGIANNKFPLQTLAQEVEEEEGRGRPEVVTLPESLCRLMSSKSYQWCLAALNKAPASSSHYHKKLNGKGPVANRSRGGSAPYKRTVKKGNRRKANGTVFQVSLPLTEGSVLLRRTSFSRDRVPLSTAYEPPPSDSPRHRWTGMGGHPVDLELHCGDGEGSEFGSQAGLEEPSGQVAQGNQEADGDFVQEVRPDSLRVANVLSSLVNDEGSDDGSEERHNWGTTRTVWLSEPPWGQSGSDVVGGPLPHSYSEPADDYDGGRSRLEHGGGLPVSMSHSQNLENTSGQASCYYQHYQYMALGGAVVQKAAPCSDASNINVPLLFGGPLAAVGGTAAVPQPTDYNHQWQSVMSFMPIGRYQATPQGHATPGMAWCQSWGPGRETTPDQASQIGPAPYTAQPHYHSQHALMWTLR